MKKDTSYLKYLQKQLLILEKDKERLIMEKLKEEYLLSKWKYLSFEEFILL